MARADVVVSGPAFAGLGSGQETAMVDRILEILGSARERKPMYLGTVDVASAESFLNGFLIGCFACGLEVPLEIQEQATIERGWPWYASRPIPEMRERGLSEEQIVDELFAIQIAAWEMCRLG
jgi:hypothetical protein